MSTTTHQQPRTRTIEKTQHENSSVLDAALNETERRVQSIRATAASYLGVPPDKVCDLLRNVWKVSNGKEPLQDSELFMGMSMIARFGLDPIAKEIYVTRDGKGRLLNIIGIDGWVKILDRTDHYDGHEQAFHEGANGEMEWIETRIYSSKRSHPTCYRAYMKEYRAISGFIAGKIPIHMLGIFSLRHAARRFVPLGGHVVTEEEANYMATGDIQRDAKGSSQLDELTAALLKPVLQHPSEPEATTTIPQPTTTTKQPTLDEHFATYQAELLDTSEVRKSQEAYDKCFNPAADIPWTDEHRSQGERLRESHQASIRKARGQKPGQLLETGPTQNGG